MNTFFTADLHLDHANIIKHCDRPFSNKDEMNDTIIKNWNSVVTNNDKVFILGDFVWTENKSRILELIELLNFRTLYLLPGNHDRERILKALPLHTERKVELLPTLYDTKIDDLSITLCHYPMISWNKSFHGAWQLFGHVHGREIPINKKLQLDVGVDTNNFYPYDLETIKKTLEPQK